MYIIVCKHLKFLTPKYSWVDTNDGWILDLKGNFILGIQVKFYAKGKF